MYYGTCINTLNNSHTLIYLVQSHRIKCYSIQKLAKHSESTNLQTNPLFLVLLQTSPENVIDIHLSLSYVANRQDLAKT